ncbi:sodium:solute symporter [Streptomyces sp. TR06-5]|uniref:sodium:solute symporter n=1 Tax=unclassified Streptomyces TaxID=2593676 RepID=UPI0039A36A53
MTVDYAVIVMYLAGMVGVGWWGMRKARSTSDYLVAGRRLGPALYSGTMAAIVLGGASTIGGVGLGYRYGLSGAWLVVTIGVGLLVLSIVFSARISRLRVYTVGRMLELRYGGPSALVSGIVMWAYTLMLAATSTIAYATIFDVVLGLDRVPAILLGGTIVVCYSALGGMWSITLTDMVQFVVQTLGVLILLLPLAVYRAGGWDGMRAELPDDYFSPMNIGTQTVITYVLVYSFGMLIGQDIWQRVFTARSDRVARNGGTVAGTYCLAYALAGAVIGTAAKVLYPNLARADNAFAVIAGDALPVGVTGLVLAAALSAVMSTSSGALIACATVARNDIWVRLRRRGGRCAADGAAREGDEVRDNRTFVVLMGVAVIAISVAIDDVVAALTVAYNLLVGGLLVPILGGLVWKRGTAAGAFTAVGAGGITVVVTMIAKGMLATEPIYYGLIAALVAYVAVSLAGRPTDPERLEQWRERLAGRGDEAEPSGAEGTAGSSASARQDTDPAHSA